MMGIEQKARDFVSNNSKFKEITSQVFKKLSKAGTLSAQDAAQATDILFDQLQTHLDVVAIPVAKPTPAEVVEMFALSDTDKSAGLNEKEFQAFYAQVVIFAATRAAKGLGISYGSGILAGVAGLMVAKRAIRAIPVVGLVGGPIVGLLPTILVGPALGIAATYAIRKFGLKALKERLFSKKSDAPPQFKAS